MLLLLCFGTGLFKLVCYALSDYVIIKTFFVVKLSRTITEQATIDEILMMLNSRVKNTVDLTRHSVRHGRNQVNY